MRPLVWFQLRLLDDGHARQAVPYVPLQTSTTPW
ncbi:Uncharacterised protein [Mycobacteroides abscessus subsp. bolletii]|nr:Uncharacterised protein [Mycobacteroides abscessus subsp. bolletii]SLF73317.1 Uncharacterised protein [Mycobacteroides abscessus subsp. bolletii]